MSHTYPFPRPQLAVDAVVFGRKGPGGLRHVLLIRRGKEPYKYCWAFPGGFFDMTDESTEWGAARELREETGIELFAGKMEQLRVFSSPGRDPRERVISVAHVAFIDELPECKGADDAADARWFPIADVHLDMFAFDHKRIYAKALRALMDHDAA